MNNLRVSGSWDKSVILWDHRSSQPSSSNVEALGKVYSLSVIGFKIVVATSERHIAIYDVRLVNWETENIFTT